MLDDVVHYNGVKIRFGPCIFLDAVTNIQTGGSGLGGGPGIGLDTTHLPAHCLKLQHQPAITAADVQQPRTFAGVWEKTHVLVETLTALP